MNEIQIQNIRDRIELAFQGNLPDEVPVKELLEKLSFNGFFKAPASTKYHLAEEGGLAIHSMNVTKRLLELTDFYHLEWMRLSSPYIVGLLHDLCKCDCYIKDSDGNWKYNPDILIPGHGEKSVMMAQKILGTPLTEEETLCIRWHMGAFDDKDNWKYYTNSIHKYPNVLYTHMADMMAAHIDEVASKKYII